MTAVSVEFVADGNTSLSPGYNISSGDVAGGSSLNYTGDAGKAKDYLNPYDIYHIKVTFIVLYSLVFACCFFGNLLVILVILRHRKMRTVTNFFLGNLAVADFCVGVFCVIPNLLHNITLKWILGQVLCKLYHFVQSMSYTASVIILTIISAERYLAIIYPIKSKQVTSLCLLRGVIIAVWFVAAMCAMPYLFLYNNILIVDSYYCIPHNSIFQFNDKVHTVVNVLLGYIIPLILMSCMYTRISMVLWSTSRGNNLGVTMSAKQKAKKDTSIGRQSMEDDRPSYLKSILRSGKKTQMHDLNEGSVDEVAELNPGNGAAQTNVVGVNWCSESANPATNTSPCHHSSSRAMEELAMPVDYEDDWPKKQHRKKSKSLEMNRMATGGCFSGGSNGQGMIISGGGTPQRNSTPIRENLATDRKPENALIARRKVIRLLVSVIVSFALCVLPYHIRMCWSVLYATKVEFQLLQPITFLCYYMNSGLNPLLYAFLSENFRRSLVEVVTCSTRRHKYTTIKSHTYGSKTTHYTVHSTVNS